MLSPKEFSVGCIGDVVSDLTLVLPRGQYEYPMLVTRASGSPFAVFLAGQHKFAGFDCTNSDAWGGILIPNVTVEIDEDSIADSDFAHLPLGSLLRRGTLLCVVTQLDSGYREVTKAPLIAGLPACRPNKSAGFTKWGVYIGEGLTKRELICIDVTIGSTS